jgi:hypothetical protein
MIANLIDIPWINQFSGVQQFAAGLVLGGTVWAVEVLYRRRKASKS